jgi:hypothetical protein
VMARGLHCSVGHDPFRIPDEWSSRQDRWWRVVF